MKKNYLIVESPFQLLSALEAIEHYSIDSYCIYVRYSSNVKNTSQIRYILSNLDKSLGAVKSFSISSSNHKLKDYIKMFYFMAKFGALSLFSDKVFLGNYESRFLSYLTKTIPKSKIILLDDGAKSINIQSRFRVGSNFDLFSMFPLEALEGQKIDNNVFTYLKGKMDRVRREDRVVFFLGAPLVNIGAMSKGDYLNKVKEIIRINNVDNLLYVSHRSESVDILEEISTFKGVTVKSFDYPIELYGLYNGSVPSRVVSFYSTALVSMSLIYSIPVTAYMFSESPDDIPKYGAEIHHIYSIYKDIINVEKI